MKVTVNVSKMKIEEALEKCFELNGYFKRRRGEVLIVCEVEDLSKGKADNILKFKVERR